jgi:hypothetical protein
MIDSQVTISLIADADKTHRWQFADAQGRRHGEAIANYMRMRSEYANSPHTSHFQNHCTQEIERHAVWCRRWFGIARLIQR